MVGTDFNLAPEDRAKLHTGSRWIAVARTFDAIDALKVRGERWQVLERVPRYGVWTDDYSNVLSAFIK